MSSNITNDKSSPLANSLLKNHQLVFAALDKGFTSGAFAMVPATRVIAAVSQIEKHIEALQKNAQPSYADSLNAVAVLYSAFEVAHKKSPFEISDVVRVNAALENLRAEIEAGSKAHGPADNVTK